MTTTDRTTERGNETRIEADQRVPLIRITREFDAPPEKVFRAHTDPYLFARWIGPRDLVTRIDGWDCRTGGSYRFVQSRGEDEFAFRGAFHEVRPGELIVQTFTFEGMPDGVVLEKLFFEALGEGRTRLVSTGLVDSFEARDAVLAGGMEHGAREGYEKLDELLVPLSG